MRPILPLCLWAAVASAQGPITLGDAVAETLEKNVLLLAQKAEIPIAEARILTAGLRKNPTLTLSTNHLDGLGTGFNGDNGGGPSETNSHIDFTLERGGKRQARVEVARAARSVAELQFLDAARQATQGVRDAFVDVLLARESLTLARQNLESLESIVTINEARLKAGDIAEVEVIRARLAALQMRLEARQAESRHRSALLRLQTAMGRSKPVTNFEVSGDLLKSAPLPALEELLRTAAEGRPDLRAAQKDTDRAAAELKSQQAQAKVDFTLGAEYTRQFFNAKSNSLGFSFSADLPVYNRNQGEILRAREEQRQAKFKALAQANAVAAEVAAAYEDYLTARDLLGGIEGPMLTQARDVREITEFSYKRGDSTLLELLDAQRAFNETMQGYLEARAAFTRSLYLLESVSGKAIAQ